MPKHEMPTLQQKVQDEIKNSSDRAVREGSDTQNPVGCQAKVRIARTSQAYLTPALLSDHLFRI